MDQKQCIGLQEAIMRVEFILNYLLMSDIMFHLSICSKLVQRSSTLPWMFPNAVYSLQQTLNACRDNLTVQNLQSPSLLNSIMFPKFANCYKIISKKEFKGCQLIDVPINTARTRSRSVVAITSVEFMNAIINKYQEYIEGLQKKLENRFASGTYQICKSMGNLFDFN